MYNRSTAFTFSKPLENGTHLTVQFEDVVAASLDGLNIARPICVYLEKEDTPTYGVKYPLANEADSISFRNALTAAHNKNFKPLIAFLEKAFPGNPIIQTVTTCLGREEQKSMEQIMHVFGPDSLTSLGISLKAPTPSTGEGKIDYPRSTASAYCKTLENGTTLNVYLDENIFDNGFNKPGTMHVQLEKRSGKEDLHITMTFKLDSAIACASFRSALEAAHNKNYKPLIAFLEKAFPGNSIIQTVTTCLDIVEQRKMANIMSAYGPSSLAASGISAPRAAAPAASGGAGAASAPTSATFWGYNDSDANKEKKEDNAASALPPASTTWDFDNDADANNEGPDSTHP
jgi:hypothetical protein